MRILRSLALAAGLLLAIAGQSGRADAGALGNCYVTAGAGYGWSADDSLFATVSPATPTPPNGFVFSGAQTLSSASGPVGNANVDGSWFGEIGVGCAFIRETFVRGGSIKDDPSVGGFAAPGLATASGWRGDVTFGFHSGRDVTGTPVNPPPLTLVAAPPRCGCPQGDPSSLFNPQVLRSHLQTYTVMFNVYYDLPGFDVASGTRLVPYLGAGLGAGFLSLDGTTFVNGVEVALGNTGTTNLAWSLMAGVSTDIGSGVMLDIGYRYLNLGDIQVAGSSPAYLLKVNDASEHQVMAGVRVPLSSNTP